jgi:hypothetical protein
LAPESTAKNLRAITEALDQHDRTCAEPVLAILMNPFEVGRLGWEDVRGVPVQGHEKVPTGRFWLLCDGEHGKPPWMEVEDAEPVDAVTKERELMPA